MFFHFSCGWICGGVRLYISLGVISSEDDSANACLGRNLNRIIDARPRHSLFGILRFYNDRIQAYLALHMCYRSFDPFGPLAESSVGSASFFQTVQKAGRLLCKWCVGEHVLNLYVGTAQGMRKSEHVGLCCDACRPCIHAHLGFPILHERQCVLCSLLDNIYP